ncbi:DEAD/DEAH box helicase [Methanococcus voltae]|uniref:DEAD/DEAH box helicase domain protein n=1 Tax=Methanococcus voltae (strain ATCC BAA-1334 / A3) TaxID=456320 RepID=D7DSR8_METV3|nr:DEAD/DEAH box helicase [Methanococcus voltae]MCS3901779.1 superfamily II DNA/RNA helicase [Methanococcus voltae]
MENLGLEYNYNILNQEYLKFIVSTISRNNEKLKNELNDLFSKNEVLFKDLLVQALPEYEIDKRGIEEAGFNPQFKDFLDKTDVYNPYIHQFEGWKKINDGKNCVIATGTGSGKTETFLMPIFNHCIQNKHNGVQTILIYPLKALAKDQKERIDNYLKILNKKYRSNISCGVFDGDLSSGEKNKMIDSPPNILLTNYVMLERILLNPNYIKLLNNAEVKFIVLDEIHYYSGAQGIDVSLLIRRLQFYLSTIQANKYIQYIGTSATLGKPDSKEVLNFLKKLFNKDFEYENIIFPQYSEKYLKNPLKNPVKIKDLKNLPEESLGELRTHAFYRGPPKIYRCLECGKLHMLDVDKCDCGSNLVFEIYTCRNCGEEYINYEYIEKGAMTYKSLRRKPLEKYSVYKNYEDKKLKIREIILSKENYNNETALPVKLCKQCHSLHHESQSTCKCGNSKNFYDLYINITNKNKELSSKNDKYCPKCDYNGYAYRIIKGASEISDEFCAQSLFDELFITLPDHPKRKVLIFTDNVQRASRFARNIEEYHFEKIIRKKLLENISKVEKPIKIKKLMEETLDELDEFRDISEYKNRLQQCIYEELFAKGSNVTSLANKNIFEISMDTPKISNIEVKEKYNKFIKIFFKNRQISEYYDLLMDTEDNLHKKIFLSNEDIKKNAYNKMYGIPYSRDKTSEKDLKMKKIEKMINILSQNEVIILKDNKYFLRIINLYIKKNQKTMPKHLNNHIENNEMPFLISDTDTGKKDAKKRAETENSFKNESENKVNFLVATPTLELGIDIGTLNAIGLLYAPPSPAQYVQRMGRGGRRGSSTLGVTYLSTSALDTMYYHDVESLTNGLIKPPAFSIDLELPLSKALFSLFLHYILTNTDFEFKLPGDWKKLATWKNNLDCIIILWKKYEEGYFKYLKKYLKDSGLDYPNYKNLIEEWSYKIKEYAEIEASLRTNGDIETSSKGVFNYFQEAGLLPDYAFGVSGSKLIIRSKNEESTRSIITGYGLEEICPPSTLDHDKKRYFCERLRGGTALKTLALNYYKCTNTECNDKEIYYTNNQNICPICGNPLSKMDCKILEPKVVYAKKSYVKKLKGTIFEPCIFNMPQIEKFNKVSKPFECEIGHILKAGHIQKNIKELIYCKNCNKITYKDNKDKCCNNPLLTNLSTGNQNIGSGTKLKFGTKFKTKGVLLKIPPKCNKKTMLNTIISAIILEAGCEDGEVSGMLDVIDNTLLFYDNVEGGVGFVDVLYTRYSEILKTAEKLCKMDCCVKGCVKCIGSYRRQFDLPYLNKESIIEVLENMNNI